MTRVVQSGPGAGLFFLDQHGCAKNQVDAEIISGLLLEMGWKRTEVSGDAQLIIVNSCGFIESAKKESIEAVLTARASCPQAKVLLAGCLAERYADELKDSLVEADGFFGNGDLSRLSEIVAALFPQGVSGKATVSGTTESVTASSTDDPAAARNVPVLRPPQRGVCGGERPELLSFPRSAYVKITEGCDNCCSFCAIPLIRGALRSRTSADITAEIRQLLSRGVYEFNLIGQDLASWGRGQTDPQTPANATVVPASAELLAGPAVSEMPSPLSTLLRDISALPGDFRVRLLYIHPDKFPLDILPVMTADARFYPYFDIPFQSGSEAVLKRMNRRGSAERYLALVSDIRKAFMGGPYGRAVIRTTFLTGFPGESDADFETTARFLSELRSLWSGSFMWSEEEGTAAADMKARVTKKAAKTRQQKLQAIQTEITPVELAVFVGETVDVLVEELIPQDQQNGRSAEEIEDDSSLALGRAWFQALEVDGAVVLQYEQNKTAVDGGVIVPGSIVKARIIAVNGVDVEAIVV